MRAKGRSLSLPNVRHTGGSCDSCTGDVQRLEAFAETILTSKQSIDQLNLLTILCGESRTHAVESTRGHDAVIGEELPEVLAIL